nr:MAG TPA: hypothetical protein [Caudoviricetes sp.]
MFFKGQNFITVMGLLCSVLYKHNYSKNTVVPRQAR